MIMIILMVRLKKINLNLEDKIEEQIARKMQFFC